jgi:RNA polymerase sigma factor (sigma-70 family)
MATESEGSDAELLLGSVSDTSAFGVLYERHVAAILAFHYRRTSCAQTAADLTAETFAEAFASRRQFCDVGAPGRAWLFTIAQRQLARFARRERVSERYRRRLGLDPVVVTPEDFDRIEELCDMASMRRSLGEALARLPASQADAVRLRVALELPYSEVAQRLGCSEGAARVRVSRGLIHLAEYLEAT